MDFSDITWSNIEAANSFLYHHGMSIGTFIQAWRVSKKQSLEALSDAAGLDPQLLEQIENSQIDPPAGTLETLAAALHIPASWLFDMPESFDALFDESQEDPAPPQIDPVTDRILTASRMDRSLYVLLTALVQAGDPKLLRAAEMSLRSLVKQSRQATVPWQQRPSGHFEPPND
jgi:transcriptional regulator with XRE-family HTH domain